MCVGIVILYVFVFQKMHRSLTISPKVLYIAVLFLLLPSRSKCDCQQGRSGIFRPNFQLRLFGNLYRYDGTHDKEINADCVILPNDLFVDHHNISVSFHMLWKCIEISLHRRVILDLEYFVICEQMTSSCILLHDTLWSNYVSQINILLHIENWIDHFQFIYIRMIWIYHIEEMAFAGVHYLRTMRLQHLGLKSMPPITPVKSNLEELILKCNNISFVPSNYFLGFKKLKILSLRDNTLHSVPDVTLLHHTILELHLNSNNIHSLLGALNGTIYPLLRQLSLGGNVISSVDTAMLSLWPSLRIWDLSSNAIINLPASYPENNLKNCSNESVPQCDISFNRNPIHCDKVVEEIVIRRRNDRYSVYWNCFVRINNLWLTFCNSPLYLRGRHLAELGMLYRMREKEKKRGSEWERGIEGDWLAGVVLVLLYALTQTERGRVIHTHTHIYIYISIKQVFAAFWRQAINWILAGLL